MNKLLASGKAIARGARAPHRFDRGGEWFSGLVRMQLGLWGPSAVQVIAGGGK